MKYWAILTNTWVESWARKLSLVLAVLVAALVLLYAFGFQVTRSQENPTVAAISVFGTSPADQDDGGSSPNFIFPVEVIAHTSVLLTLGLLNPWGILLALFIVVPLLTAALQPQNLYLLLAKPVSRPGLLLSKYLGGVSLFAATAMVYVGCMAGLIAWKTGVFVDGLIGAGLLVCLNFSVYAAVTLLVAVWTRSTGISLVVAILFYGVNFAVFTLHSPEVHGLLSDLWRTVVDVAYTVLPKTAAIDQTALDLISGQPVTEGVYNLGSSIAFLAVMLGLSAWEFQRKDF